MFSLTIKFSKIAIYLVILINIHNSVSQAEQIINQSGLSANNYYFSSKIAVVDVDSIFVHSAAAAKVKASVNNLSKKIQDELLEKEIELKKLEAQLISKRGTISELEFDQLVANFNKKVNQTQKKMRNRKMNIEKIHAAAIAKIQKITVDIINQLSQKYDIQLVLPSSQILFAHQSLNMTAEVILNLNKALPQITIDYDYKEEH